MLRGVSWLWASRFFDVEECLFFVGGNVSFGRVSPYVDKKQEAVADGTASCCNIVTYGYFFDLAIRALQSSTVSVMGSLLLGMR